MKVSLITVVYNDRRVGRALDSILAQRHDAQLELIVVDGQSTDGTLDVLEEYRPHLTTLISEPDHGIYDAMNKGIARATGDVVGILNADDVYQDAYVLKDVMSAFHNPQVDACYGDLVYVDDRDQVVRYWRSGQCRRGKFHFGWVPPHPTFFARRRVYDRYGAFDTLYRIAADYELLVRFLLKNRVMSCYVDRVFVRMATGGKSNRAVTNIVRANYEVYLACRRNGLPLGYHVPFLKLAQKAFQFLHRPQEKPQVEREDNNHYAKGFHCLESPNKTTPPLHCLHQERGEARD